MSETHEPLDARDYSGGSSLILRKRAATWTLHLFDTSETPDGFDIAYAVSGEGRPLVLMPQPVNHIGIEWGSATYGPFWKACHVNSG